MNKLTSEQLIREAIDHYDEGWGDENTIELQVKLLDNLFRELVDYFQANTAEDVKSPISGLTCEHTKLTEGCPCCHEWATGAPAEDEVVFCPTCKTEVQWVKGWYDCDYCGQLKEHPLMDTANTAEDEAKLDHRIATFMDRIVNAKIDDYDWGYICNSTDCKNAVDAYKDWLQQEDK